MNENSTNNPFHVVFIIKGRYPTEKAYGITTSAMIDELEKLNFKVTVWALGESKNKSQNQVRHYDTNFVSRRLLEYSKRDSKFLNIIAWKIAWALILYANRKSIKCQQDTVYWTRDFFIPRYLENSRFSQKYVVEVHEDPKFLHFLTRRKIRKVVFAPISKRLIVKLNERGINDNVVYSPMGISESTLVDDSNISRYCKNIVMKKKLLVSYVGKLNPTGYSKGYEAIFNLLGDQSFEILIAGYLPSEKSALESVIANYASNKDRIKILPHVSHREALNIMRSSDFLILTAPKSPRYLGFPLKALEYLSAGKIVLVEESQLYREIFGSSFNPYWFDPSTPESIIESARYSLQDVDLEKNLLVGKNFAANHLWNRRVQNILQALQF